MFFTPPSPVHMMHNTQKHTLTWTTSRIYICRMLNIQTHILTIFTFRIYVNVFYFLDSPPSPSRQCNQNAEHSKAKAIIDIVYVQNIHKCASFFFSTPPPLPPSCKQDAKHSKAQIDMDYVQHCFLVRFLPTPPNNTVYCSVL